MLSYQHEFHAGNHADILKHATLTLVLDSLLKKDKPFTAIDTHAGAGFYYLDDERALKTGETADGILKLLACSQSVVVPAALEQYLSICREYATDNRYPGSPEIISTLMRPQDRLILMELHPAEIEVLRMHMEGAKSRRTIGIHHRNGFEGIEALTPPLPRRGVALMDPSYETDSDFIDAAHAISRCAEKWTAGILMLWYPLLHHRKTDLLILKQSICATVAAVHSKKVPELQSEPHTLSAELQLRDDDGSSGMYGSGMLVINPPWQLDCRLREILPFLAKVLTLPGNSASWKVVTE